MADRELLHSITIAAPITSVWDELTRLDGKRHRAMMDTVLESALTVGAPLYYRSTDGKRVFVIGRVVAIEPPRLLSHTWRLTVRGGDDPWTLVSWTLDEVAGGTRVTLRHSGWPADTKRLDSVERTWQMCLDELKRLVETGDISTGLKIRYALMRAFMWAMPARTRAANAPEPPPVPQADHSG